MAKAAKFDNWVNLFKFKIDWALNPELPVMTPGRPSRRSTRRPGRWSGTRTTSGSTPRGTSSRTSTRSR